MGGKGSSDELFTIVGLGNSGERYRETRHNVGFWLLERIAQQYARVRPAGEPAWQQRGSCAFLVVDILGTKCLLVMPQGFMNESGELIQPLLRFYQVEVSNLLILQDDLDLAPGALRIKRGGSAGGHNGVRDIERVLGSKEFLRLRLGIGHPRETEQAQMEVQRWVLQRPSSEERVLIAEALEKGVNAVGVLISKGLEAAQQEFNRAT